MMFRTLSILTTALGDEPPTEFRIFRKGVNTTTKGNVVFDDVAARSVMSAWRQWGVDLIVDLQHHSLVETGAAARDDAQDARGYYALELRDGELWAVNVSWTADGARRIRERTQRYISPAFVDDEATGRVVELYNCALVSMPATHRAWELIAASAVARDKAAAHKRAVEYLEVARRKLHR